jgi:hypothetical protein
MQTRRPRARALGAAALVLAALAALAFVPSAGADAAQPCDGPHESVKDDAWATVENPTQPQCGSLSDPCYEQEWGCGGCGPDLLEWVIGPIYCP